MTSFKTEPALKAKLEGHYMKTMFNDAWNDCRMRFSELRKFAGGLATDFANTASVESDFSILKWEFNANRKALGNISLGGIIYACEAARVFKKAAGAFQH